MIKAIIFDFDGTLADSFDVFIESLNAATKFKHKLNNKQIDELRKSTIQEIIKELGIHKWQIPYILYKGRYEVTKRIDEVKIFDDIPELLDQLYPKYTLFVLSTNSYENIEHVLKRYDIVKYFARIYGNVGLMRKAKSLQKLMRQQNLQPSECLYVGDEIRDIQAAQKANIKCISVSWGYSDTMALKTHNADMLAHKPLDIEKLTQKQ